MDKLPPNGYEARLVEQGPIRAAMATIGLEEKIVSGPYLRGRYRCGRARYQSVHGNEIMP